MIKAIVCVTFISQFALAQETLLPTSVVSDRAFRLATDTIATGVCSAGVAKIIPPANCRDRKVQYQVLTADHCFRNVDTGKIEATNFSLYQQIVEGPACIEVKEPGPRKSGQENRSTNGIKFSAAYPKTWKLDPTKFRRFHVKVKGITAGFDMNPIRPPKALPKGLMNHKIIPMQDFETETSSFLKRTTDIPVTELETSMCSDRSSIQIAKEDFARLGIKAFEIADRLPDPGEEVTVIGYQYGCNPVAVKCRFTGSVFADDRVVEAAVCDKGGDTRGVSGGPITNSEGKLIGIFSGVPEGAVGKTTIMFDLIQQSDVDCDGLPSTNSGTQPRQSVHRGEGTPTMGNCEFEVNKNGCYKEGSWKVIESKTILPATAPVPEDRPWGQQ
jgi:hypothetical protein